MTEKGRIVELLKEAKPRSSRSAGYLALVALVAVAVVGSVLVTRAYYSSRLDEAAARIEALEAEEQEARNQAAFAGGEVARLEDLLLYGEKLRIQSVRVRNSGGELVISGQVGNSGRRAVNDIELMAYFLGEDGRVLYEKGYVAKSPDGRPLYRGQHRRFKFVVNPAPERAEDISLIITRVDFD